MALNELRPLVQHDLAVLTRLHYKHKNQHRRAHYFSHLKHACSRMQVLLAESVAQLPAVAAQYAACKDQAKLLQFAGTLAAASHLCVEVQEEIDACTSEFRKMLALGFFLPFSVTCIAAMGRFYLYTQLVYKTVTDAHATVCVRVPAGLVVPPLSRMQVVAKPVAPQSVPAAPAAAVVAAPAPSSSIQAAPEENVAGIPPLPAAAVKRDRSPAPQTPSKPKPTKAGGVDLDALFMKIDSDAKPRPPKKQKATHG